MTENTERGFVLGGGPFQPPASADLAILRSQVESRDLRIAHLTERVSELNATLRVSTPNDLANLLNRALGSHEVFVDVDGDGELDVRIPSLTIVDGEITEARREFEVSAEVTLEVNATVIAGDEDQARDLFAAALDTALMSVDVDIEPYDGVESSYTTDADICHISVSGF